MQVRTNPCDLPCTLAISCAPYLTSNDVRHTIESAPRCLGPTLPAGCRCTDRSVRRPAVACELADRHPLDRQGSMKAGQ